MLALRRTGSFTNLTLERYRSKRVSNHGYPLTGSTVHHEELLEQLKRRYIIAPPLIAVHPATALCLSGGMVWRGLLPM